MLVQKQFQDIFTFSRASTGTRINAAGVLETVAANQPRFDYDASGAFWNLLTYSNDLMNFWSTNNGAVRQSSTQASFTTNVSDTVLHAPVTVVPGAQITTAFVVSGDVGKQIKLRIEDNGAPYGGAEQIVTLTATPTLYVLSYASTLTTVVPFIRGVGQACTVTLGGAGLFQGALTPAQIIAAGGIPLTTTAPACNPSQVIARGILIEEQRTNLWLNSNWPGVNYQSQPVTVTTNYAASPISGVNSARVTRAADANQTSINFVASGGISAAATPQAPSVFMRLNSSQPSFSVYAGNGNSTQGQYFNFTVAGGVITPIDGGKVEKLGSGWVRLSFPFTPSSAISASANLTFGFPVGALDVEFVGFQWEAGSFATSYIPTSGSQVTRSADVCSINTLSPWFKLSDGTFVFEFDFQGSCYPLSFDVGGAGFSIGTPGAISNWNGSSSLVSTTSTGPIYKGAVGYSSAGRSICVNGGAVASDANQPFPSLPGKIHVGSYASSQLFLNGHMRRLKFFPKKFSSSQQQAL